ncbi:MAG: glycosyltransferase [Vicingaceae bacterium]|nr:glycosyltransferase [Vicingaceae bacterium]
MPLIKQFLKEGNEVIIGADKNPLIFLEQEFPTLKTVTIPGVEIDYGEKGSALKLFYESVKFYNFIKKEKQFIDAFLEDNHIDMIVSDNRYGLYSNKVESVIVTHQLYPKAPVGEKLLHQKIEKLLSNFNEVWIPDYEGENKLSGELAHLKPFNYPHKFIGSLSRFKKPDELPKIEYDVCAIISGPEPQRSIFENLILGQIELNNLKAIVVRGLPNSEAIVAKNVFNHLPTKQLQDYILKSKLVVCRSGYSSIMDLAILEKNALLVPTPGQTEQEYMGDYHKNNNQFIIQKQGDFKLKI